MRGLYVCQGRAAGRGAASDVRQLAKRYSAQFVDLPAEDVLTFLKERSGMNLWLGHAAAKKRGINLDKPVTFTAADDTLADLLDMTLMGISMDWYVLEPG